MQLEYVGDQLYNKSIGIFDNISATTSLDFGLCINHAEQIKEFLELYSGEENYGPKRL